ncbi:MAG: type II secretion system protein [Gallionellaceae bacterium]|nr:type II secretion system protein [Gallionellaceae bacterium]
MRSAAHYLSRSSIPNPRSCQSGISLVELIVFIVIISIALAGILLVMNQVTGHSADTLVRKQALAIAESLLEEVELMPFTFCDPNDANAASAVNATLGAGGCATWSQDVTVGPIPAGEVRGDLNNPFDNVADYGGYTMNNITDLASNVYTGYNASVTMSRAGTAFVGAADNGAALQITVTVTAPDNSQVVLDGYRTRYAPNDLP